MNTQSAPVSDQAHRTARRVAALLANADALLITAGAGMSLDCDPPDNPDLQYLQGLFDATGRTFRHRAQPAWFDTRPHAAWAWYGMRERIYKHTRPHDGYRILRAWAQAMPGGSFVATTNIDGLFFKAGFTDWQVVERHGSLNHYQCTVPCSDTIWDAQSPVLVIDSRSLEIQGELPACPLCGAVARPNVLMYDDVKWLDAERREQQLRFDAWLASVRGQRLVVIECGAGAGSASVHRIGERLLERPRVSLVRINPTATEADDPTYVLRLPALQAITLIHDSLPEAFGGERAARREHPRPELEPVTSTLHLPLEPVTCVDLGSGLVTSFDGSDIPYDEQLAFLKRYGEAQSGWVPVPPCLGLEAPGYKMTARVMSALDDQRGRTAGAAIVFVQAPDEQAVMTFGLGRRADNAPHLWQLLYSTTDTPLAALDYPRIPWVARRPAAGLRKNADVLPYLARFERVWVKSYLVYLAFIDATQKKNGGGEST
jgi:NAD-dependent SIR2 family protein deacetylase